MSDYDDYVSDYSDIDDASDVEITGGKDEENEDVLVAPADPDEGVDDDSDADYEYSDDEKPELDDEDAPPGEPEEEEEDDVDIKKVSNYNKEIIVVKPENRRTSHILSKYEMTEIVSIRATQISQHNNCMVDTTGLDDPIKMSKLELMSRRCPLVLRRHVGDVVNAKTGEMESYYEWWSPNEMQFAVTYNDVL